MPDRKLTDEDIAALADAIHDKMIDRFYKDLGHGVWGYVWKAIILAMISMAAYGATKGYHG